MQKVNTNLVPHNISLCTQERAIRPQFLVPLIFYLHFSQIMSYNGKIGAIELESLDKDALTRYKKTYLTLSFYLTGLIPHTDGHL